MKFSLSVAIALVIAPCIFAQSSPDPLKGADSQSYKDLRAIKKPVIVDGDEKATAENRRVMTLQAKYMVGRFLDPKRISADDWSRIIQEAINNDLPINNSRPRVMNEKYMEFGREMGNILVKELEPALKSQKIVVRVNAARLLSIIGQMGCAKSAELALKIIADPEESDGVKFYGLQTLTNLFMFEPDATLADLSVFQVKDRNKKDERELERKSIQALCNYVMMSRDVTGKSPEEIEAIKYVRREAVRALGHVRTHRLRFEGKVLAHPGMVLLKVANRDGIVPEPSLSERAEAVAGYCQLFPVTRANVDRDIQCDNAAALLGGAILDIATVKVQNDISLPWRVTAERFEHGLKVWSTSVAAMKLAGAEYATKLYTQTKSDVIDGLRANQTANPPNTQGFRTWLQGNPPKAKALYQDEESTTTVKPAAP